MSNLLLGDRYQIISALGAGGMGQTYIAEDMQRPGNPKCVVKQLKPASDDPSFLVTASRLFTGEAEMLEKLGKHDQIPQLLAYFEWHGEFYLVQEFIDGQPLSTELPLGQRWDEPQVIALLKDILMILEFIHEQGVIHRDIKPDNIIRRKQDGRLVLIDFGAVKQVRMQQATAAGQISVTVAIGTPGYMPTEQSSGKPRPSSDIYALGMMAIQALTGLLPSQLREDEDGEVIWQDQAEVSSGLVAILMTMTRHYFKHRYQAATEVLQALQTLESPDAVEVSYAGYTPTQAAVNGYSSTALPSNSSSTQTTQKEQIRTQNIEQSVSFTQEGQSHTLNQQWQPTAPQYEPKRDFSNNLLLAGATFLSVLIAGSVIYFSSIQPKPQPIVEVSPTTSPSASPTPVTQPPVTQPAAIQPPVTQPQIIQPSVAHPPTAQPAVTPSPTPQPQVTSTPIPQAQVTPTSEPQTSVNQQSVKEEACHALSESIQSGYTTQNNIQAALEEVDHELTTLNPTDFDFQSRQSELENHRMGLIQTQQENGNLLQANEANYSSLGCSI